MGVTRAVEIIGEAGANMTDHGRAELPDIPWPGIVKMRQRLVHGYASGNTVTVFSVA